MVTMVGTEATLPELVRSLQLLEHDAIAAYEQTISRLENESYRQQIAAFKADHDRHLEGLRALAATMGADTPAEGDMKQLLTTGKVALASIMGDAATLLAMKTNEDDTVTAYERATRHEAASPEAKRLFETALQDELRHRAWMETTASAT
jgi:rubrerythrin